ncbi:DUF2726 domain-containing protein [Metallumcola ferriviriculae]|uniref:DUF2726 domain-containing protein n=1 Tax=Metallumcola ferriviriculae TaxID=3039180 RepID=A0AAU0UL78_9FIRM|nr:DUF2726 domain-containing protein [Desulfitibacteraceae bacterium MK1]
MSFLVIVLLAVILYLFWQQQSSRGSKHKTNSTLPDPWEESSTEEETEEESVTYPYRKKKYLLSIAEKSFFQVLSTWNVKHNYYIFPKIRIADLLYIQKNTDNRQTYINKIQSKHIDFVLCDRDTISPIAAIELDDSSHQRADRIKRDEFLDKAFSDAGLPLIRVPAKRSYSLNDLSAELDPVLSPGETLSSPESFVN